MERSGGGDRPGGGGERAREGRDGGAAGRSGSGGARVQTAERPPARPCSASAAAAAGALCLRALQPRQCPRGAGPPAAFRVQATGPRSAGPQGAAFRHRGRQAAVPTWRAAMGQQCTCSSQPARSGRPIRAPGSPGSRRLRLCAAAAASPGPGARDSRVGAVPPAAEGAHRLQWIRHHSRHRCLGAGREWKRETASGIPGGVEPDVAALAVERVRVSPAATDGLGF